MLAAPARDKICYHHYSLTFEAGEVGARFGDVRFLLVAGCAHRAEKQAQHLAEHTFNGSLAGLAKCQLERLTKPLSRFALFKVGPVLVSNHGMGAASMSIALHELFLMCQVAQVIELVTVVRFGTCGGVGVPPGTVCVTNRALDSLFLDYVELKICQKLVRRPCTMDLSTCAQLEAAAREQQQQQQLQQQHQHQDQNQHQHQHQHQPKNQHQQQQQACQLGPYEVRVGATVASNDFYEEQGRTNGAICDHTEQDKMDFIRRAAELGVINMEMESNFLAAMCAKLSVSFGVVCVALNNRLLDDRVLLDRQQMDQFERRLFCTNAGFIVNKLSDRPKPATACNKNH